MENSKQAVGRRLSFSVYLWDVGGRFFLYKSRHLIPINSSKIDAVLPQEKKKSLYNAIIPRCIFRTLKPELAAFGKRQAGK